MSSVEQESKSTEKSSEECTLDVPSPYHNEIESFDNPDLYPELKFVVAGMEKPLQLHRRILANASEHIKEKLKGIRDLRFEWSHDTSNEIDREALVKALRFCYGETMNVGTKNGECCAVIAALTRLQVNCLDDVVALLKDFAVNQTKKDVKVGVELLKACASYPECCGMNECSLNRELAGVLLTKEMMHEHYKEVVDECLMLLPPEYLKLAVFGEPHTRCSEFCLKTKYLRLHSKEMTREEEQGIVTACKWSTLNSQELRELRLADIIDKGELLKAYEQALEYSEIENERANEREKKAMKEVKSVKKEKDEMMKRIREVETERDGYKERAVKAEKEKEEMLKQLEKQREEIAKQTKEDCQKYQSRECTLEALLRGNRLSRYTLIGTITTVNQ